MYDVWEEYFNDVPRKNFVITKFGKHAKRQLGCIKYSTQRTKIKTLLKKYEEDIGVQDIDSVTVILLTRYFIDEDIPEFILVSTLAHEITHYAHGFHSPLPKMFEYPHKGGVVRKEMEIRGLGQICKDSELWLKENWLKTIRNK